MSSFLFAVDRVLPLFLMILIGALVRRAGWINDTVLPALNKICFYLLLPCMIMDSALDSDLSALDSPRMYVYAVLAYTLFTAALVLLSRRFIKEPARAGAFAHATFRPNTVLIGIPLIVSVLGSERALPAILLVVLLNPFDNVYGILALQFFSGGKERKLSHELLEVARNPLVISAFLGILMMLLPFELPHFISSTISSFGGASLAVAMIIIGARFQFKGIRNDLPLILLSSFVRLILMPTLIALGGYVLGVRGVELASLWLVMAMPTAAVSSIITGLMGCDGNLGDKMTIVSTALSTLTLIAGVSLFVALGVI